MPNVKSFDVGLDVSAIQEALSSRRMPGDLIKPMRALVGAVLARADDGPLSIYIGSTDDEREARNHFAALLARLVTKAHASTLLVDCDFVAPGLNGVIPQRDALGFLDLLLYGSSLGVVTQTSRYDIKVIGAGSFPVGKKSPFVMDAFESTRSYLSNHASCTIFVGPALDDDDNVHPILQAVDLGIVFRTGPRARPGRLEGIEGRVAKVLDEAFVVRLAPDPRKPVEADEPSQAELPPVPPPDDGEDEQIVPLESIAEELGAETAPAPGPAGKGVWGDAPAKGVDEILDSEGSEAGFEEMPPGDGDVRPTFEETVVEGSIESMDEVGEPPRNASSALPRIVVSALAVAFIGFLFWWLYLMKSVPADGDEATISQLSTLTTAPADTAAPPAAAPDTTTQTPPAQPQTVGPAEDAVEANATDDPDAHGNFSAAIVVTSELDDYAGQYGLHISSFRNIEDARTDAYYLNDRGFPIIIAEVDLGSKGRWYRVYVGPYQGQEEALGNKIKLDGLQRVKFTRITKLSG